MKFRLQITILASIMYLQVSCQDTIIGIIPERGKFDGLKSTQIAKPDSVFVLYLGNSNLREFPTEILRFKNIEFIDFLDFDIVEINISDSLKLSVTDRKLARKLFAKYWAGTSRVPDINNFPVRNRNLIKHIPYEICTLTKLQAIRFSKHQISRRQKKKLHKLLPNCEIEVL